ncbi:MAG: polyamine ABC transporter ATP-binding protein [Anaerolineaceae bacterium]|nr:polyamine ABC transporter ATP-binding protein [Anaerolineaceae bacterium]
MAFLELTNIRKEFSAFTAVEDFNLKVDKGEFVSFLGPSGCGKTTTLRMIAGFEKQTRGHITIDNNDVTNVPANKRNIGMVFQSYALFPNLSVANNIGFGLKVRGEAAPVIKQRVSEMLDLIRMQEFAHRFPHQLSGGQQQRVALGRAIAIRPQVLLMDEPLSALDAKIRISLRQEIRAIQRQLGITTIYVTHDQEEALSISDRIVVMSKGRMEQVGTPLDIYNTPETRFVASFVGTLNLLDAKVVDARAGRIKIDEQEIEIGQQLLGAQVGNGVSVAIRPEAISINGESGGLGNHLNGAVEDVSFLGSVVRVRVKLETQHINFDAFNNPNLKPPTIGQPVSLSFMPEACMVVRDE